MKPIFEQERQFFKKQTGIDLPINCWRKSSKIYLDPTCEKPLYIFKVENHIVKITKDNTKLFKDYRQKSVEELIELYNSKLNYLENLSIAKTFDYIVDNPDIQYVISHSGGKDSTVTFNIWNKTLESLKELEPKIYNKLKWEINFSNTSNETADTYKYIKKLPKDRLYILNPKVGFYQWLIQEKNYFVPSVFVRNCCSTYKEGQLTKAYDTNAEITMVLGVRKYESTKRSKYDYIMDDEFNKKLHGKNNLPEKWVNFAPIVEWKDEEVWLYILREELEVNKQYYLGFNRVGCLLCPYQSDYIDLVIQEHYPKQWKRWVSILQENYNIYGIKNRLKWTFEEWKTGMWKQGKSKEQYIISKKATKERVRELAEIKGISEELAEKYFKRKCSCGKSLNPTEVAINLKMYGRNMELEKMECRKCFCISNDIKSSQYKEMVITFTNGGCNLF